MYSWLEPVLQHLANLSAAEVLCLFTILMIIESAGWPAPSEIILPAAGWWVRQSGYQPAPLGLLLVFIACTAGALIGCLIAYGIGYRGGRPLKMRRYLLVTPTHLENAQRWLNGRGAWAVVVSRLMVGVRSVVSYPLGMAHMPLTPFVIYSLIGISIFNASFILLGYQLGEASGRQG